MAFFTATKELKVLVDLALISAGESDIETDRISSLHTSCLGFAPLIFDLKENQEHKVNFDELMKACEPVWKAVEADQSLPQKLVRNDLPATFYDLCFANEYFTHCNAIFASNEILVNWIVSSRLPNSLKYIVFCLLSRSD